MRRKLENIYLKWKWNAYNAAEKLLRDESGDSNMVAVIVLIVIILAAAAIFRERLLEAVNAIFDKLTDFIG